MLPPTAIPTPTRTMFVRDFGNGFKAYLFWCPACNCLHSFDVGNPDGPIWTFDGDLASPTFTPSLRYVRSGCHLFLRKGIISYCSDCSHAMAGLNVPLKPFDDT